VEIQYTAKGIPVYCFSIANNLNKQVNKNLVRVPNYFNFRLLGKRWEGISSWLIKGRLVSMQGRLEQDRWEKDGNRRSCMKIAVVEIQPLWSGHINHHAPTQEGEAYIPGGETAGDNTPEITAGTPSAEAEGEN
jgi:single-strand DNA-binding protein